MEALTIGQPVRCADDRGAGLLGAVIGTGAAELGLDRTSLRDLGVEREQATLVYIVGIYAASLVVAWPVEDTIAVCRCCTINDATVWLSRRQSPYGFCTQCAAK